MRHQFGVRLKQLRADRKVLQRDLEKALNLRPGAASQYERGLREPGFDMLLAVADFFDVSVDYLLGRAGARPESPALASAQQRLASSVGCIEGQTVAELLATATDIAPDVFGLPHLARRLGIPEQTLHLACQGEPCLSQEMCQTLVGYFGLDPHGEKAPGQFASSHVDVHGIMGPYPAG